MCICILSLFGHSLHWASWVNKLSICPPQMYQSSPGGQSSCSSEPSPLGSASHHDGGLEPTGLSGGSMGDLSALDDMPLVDSTVSTGMLGLHLRKNASPAYRLTHLKQERLKSVRDSCSWANPTPPAPSTKLPPINIGE